MKSATSIIVTANGDKDNLIKKGVLQDSIHVIFNGADTDTFKPLDSFEVKKIRENLDPDYQKIFVNFSLDKPDKSGINEILKNVAYFFPSPEKKFLFVDAFQDLYEKILREWRRFLGTGLTKEMIEKVRSIRVNMERFSMDSKTKQRMINLLDGIINEYEK